MPLIALKAGFLQVQFDPALGVIGSVFAGRHEVLRGIGAPVRDHAWGTVRPVLSRLSIKQDTGSFRVTFAARCRSGPVDFAWQGLVLGTADGRLAFEFTGRARRKFLANRIGFCVLHPAGGRSGRCRVEHADGQIEHTRFPRHIAPRQPFLDVRAIRHPVQSGVWAEVRLEGDDFETEDQRNWTDASFKTYCRSLTRPFPFTVSPGERISQRITLTWPGGPPSLRPTRQVPWSAPREVRIFVGRKRGPKLPPLGTGWHAQAVQPEIFAALRRLKLAHLRVDLDLAHPRHLSRLRVAARTVTRLGCALEPALILSRSVATSLLALRNALTALSPAVRIARWLVFDRQHGPVRPECLAAVRATFAGSPFAAPVGTGAKENFTELNRHRRGLRGADFTVHALNPQVHAFDDDSVRQTLPIQGLTVLEARRISRGRPVVVSSVNLTRRWRRGETGAPAADCGLPPFQTDIRQTRPFCAAWTLGSIVSLASAGATSLTYHEAAGPNGILGEGGVERPVARIFRLVAALAARSMCHVRSSHPQHVTALAVQENAGCRVLLANLGDAPQQVCLSGSRGVRTVRLAPHGVRSFLIRTI